MTTLVIDSEACTRCGICSEICPMGIIVPGNEGKPPEVPRQAEPYCIRCGHCAVGCPERAVSIDFLREREIPVPEGFPPSPDLIAYYLKNRRSVRHYTKKTVPRDTIRDILEVARYAPSGGNQQPVHWTVIYDSHDVHHLAGLIIDWIRHEAASDNPSLPGMMTSRLISSWENGADPICRGAPHLLIAAVRAGPGSATVDGVIAVTYADAAAPAFGVGTCWAGFLSLGVKAWHPAREALALPDGYEYCAGLMCGYPKFRTYGIPPRNPLKVTWR